MERFRRPTTIECAEDFQGFRLGGGSKGEEAQVRLFTPRQHRFTDFVFGVVFFVICVISGSILPDGLLHVNYGQHLFHLFGGFTPLGAMCFVYNDSVAALRQFPNFVQHEGEFLQGGDDDIDSSGQGFG